MNISLYVPAMWKSIVKELAVFAESNRFSIEVKTLPIHESGWGTHEYDKPRQSLDSGSYPVLIIPAAHSVRAIDHAKLKILGVAVRTRNDIYAFRLRERPGDYFSPTSNRIRIGVPEINITTADICRVILRKWTPDIFGMLDFCAEKSTHFHNCEIDRDAIHSVRDTFCKRNIRHIAIPSPRERLRLLEREDIAADDENNILDVAIFVGKELDLKDVRRSYEKKTIDGANLNHVINNIYSTSLFPRTVFAVFADAIAPHESLLGRFVEIVNLFVDDRLRKKRADRPWSRLTTLSFLGEKADVSDIRTLMSFVGDIADPTHWQTFTDDFKDAEKLRLMESRKLVLDDFAMLPTELRDERTQGRIRYLEEIRKNAIDRKLFSGMVGEPNNRDRRFGTATENLVALIDLLSSSSATATIEDLRRLFEGGIHSPGKFLASEIDHIREIFKSYWPVFIS